MAQMLQDFADRIEREQLEVHGICVQQHGKKLDEYRWRADLPHILHSLSKSYTSIAAGIAMDEGRFSLDDKVVDFFPEQRPDVIDEKLASMTVRHLLTMSPGRDKPIMMNAMRPFIMDPDWVHYYLSQPLDRMPGEKFSYDTGCTYVVGAIIQETTGMNVREYLMPRLFEPFGIENPMWEVCPMGRSIAGAGLYLKTHEILSLGQMLLQHGVWNDRRIVSEAYVIEATRLQIRNDDNPDSPPDGKAGYGYQFWMCHNGAYRGSGAYCQLCIVSEETDSVITVTANTDEARVLDAIWDTVLPKLQEG